MDEYLEGFVSDAMKNLEEHYGRQDLMNKLLKRSKVEMFLDHHNHLMELVRTVSVVTLVGIGIAILIKI